MVGLNQGFIYCVYGICFLSGLIITIIISLTTFRLVLSRQNNKYEAFIATENNITDIVAARLRRTGRDKAVTLAILVFLIIVLGVPAIFKTVSFVKQGGWNGFSESDVTGTWTTSYEKYGCWRFTGKEILTLNNDGAYEQAFIDAVGTRQQVAQGKWELTEYQEHQVVFLEGAKDPPYHPMDDDCDNIPEKPLNSFLGRQGFGRRLRIWKIAFTTDTIILDYKVAVDPDAVTFVTFDRSE